DVFCPETIRQVVHDQVRYVVTVTGAVVDEHLGHDRSPFQVRADQGQEEECSAIPRRGDSSRTAGFRGWRPSVRASACRSFAMVADLTCRMSSSRPPVSWHAWSMSPAAAWASARRAA